MIAAALCLFASLARAEIEIAAPDSFAGAESFRRETRSLLDEMIGAPELKRLYFSLQSAPARVLNIYT